MAIKHAVLSVVASLVLLPIVGCGSAAGPGHFDNDTSCACEGNRMAEIRSDPSPDVVIDAPQGASAQEIAANIHSDLVFNAGAGQVIQIDGSPDALNGSNNSRMNQDMAELMLRNVIEMQVDPHTGLPLYTVSVSGPGERPTVNANKLVSAETAKNQR